MKRITVEVTDQVAEYLAVLADPTEGYATIDTVVEGLIDHAQQGVYRPGSWERGWLMQAFGDRWTGRLEADPDAPMMDRVKAARFLP
jgi:hypothetical protein